MDRPDSPNWILPLTNYYKHVFQTSSLVAIVSFFDRLKITANIYLTPSIFLHHDATTKANILNQQFASVFTEEDNLPDLGISPTPEMNKITINTEGVQNLLQHLKPNKATGPDDIPAKFLKEVNIEISPLISIIRSRTNSIWLETGQSSSSFQKRG